MGIARHFLDWKQPALVSAVDHLIARFAHGDQLNLSKVILVFPGRRAARRMLELLVQRAGTKWPAMVPPRMVTFNSLPELLYPQKKQLADELTQLLVWKKALFAVPQREISAAIPVRPDENSVSSWMSLCDSLRRQHNELAADGLEFDEVFEKLTQLNNTEEAQRWNALRRIQSEYLVQMDQLNLWDRQAARLIAVQQNECQTDCEIFLISTVDMSRILRQMLDQVSGRVTALIHAPESEELAFDDYGCVIPEVWEKRPLNVPLEVTRITGTPAEQAHAAMVELASFDGRFRADDITIGVADDAMVPTLMQSMADAGVAGQWPVGMLISETRPFRLLQALATHVASARDDLPADFATLSDFVRHPDVSLWIQEHLTLALTDDDAFAGRSLWLDHLDEYVNDHLQMTPGAMLGKPPRRIIVAEVCRAVENLTRCLLSESTTAENAGSAVGRLHHEAAGRPGAVAARQRTLEDLAEVLEQSLTSQLEKRRPLSEWAEGAVRILATIYHERELHSESHADRGIVACITQLQDLNEQLRRIPAAVLPLCSASQAIQLLLKQIADQTIPPEANDDAIEMLGWLELPLDDSPVLVLTGFNEGFVPESINSDAFMPNSLRTRLELTDNRRRYARDACALTAILNSRRRLVLIQGRTDVQGNPLAPSRLWFAADTDSLPDRVRWFYDPEFTPESVAHPKERLPLSAVQEESASRLSGFVVPRPVNVPETIDELRVTSFRDYLQCPYRYFLNRELRLESVEDDVRELNAAAFGTLMHDVLSKFGNSTAKDARTNEAVSSFLIQELHRQALAKFGRSRSATVSVQLKMLESRLEAFARWQVENHRAGWRIFYTEQKLVCDDFVDSEGRSIRLVGRIDRIDRHQRTGQWRILDYKTSESPILPNNSHRKKDKWVDLQLPLYRLLVKTLRIEKNIQLGYVQLPGDLSRIGVDLADWSQQELLEAIELARSIASDIYNLKIDRVASANFQPGSAISRLCQDPVINRNFPWLADWPGRSNANEIAMLSGQ